MNWILKYLFNLLGSGFCKGAGRHIGHKLRVGGEVGRYTKYSQVRTPYTENWKDNKTAQWYAGKKVKASLSEIYVEITIFERVQRSPKPLTLTMNMFLDIKSSSCA